MADQSIIDALKGVDPADAMPFGAGATPEGSPNALSVMLKGLFGMPAHLIDAAKDSTPGLRREDYTDNPAAPQPNKPLYDAAGETALGLAGVGTPMAASGAAGIFGGRLAKTADLRALDAADRMLVKGKSPEEIRNLTGWHQEPSDGQWRFEIPDEHSRMAYFGGRGPAGTIMQHDALFKAYPELQDARMETFKGAPAGLFNPNSMTASVTAPDAAMGRSIGLHELMHGVQKLEGFSPGSTPGRYATEIEQKMRNSGNIKNFDFNQIDDIARSAYNRTSGEVEARNVQKRQDYNPLQRLSNHPWQTQDVPYHEQLALNPQSYMVELLKGVK